ncbi:MAG TPA: hypothetical protein VGA34_07180, partial [Alteraurantiacibacter sp.]
MNGKFVAWRDEAISLLHALRKEKLHRVELLMTGYNGFHEARAGRMIDASHEFAEKLRSEIA